MKSGADKKGEFPDLNRLYLNEKVENEEDPIKRELFEALLEGYDSGQLIMSYDLFTQEMKYRAAEVN